MSKKRDDAINVVLFDTERIMNNLGYDAVWASYYALKWAFYTRHENRMIFNAAVAVYRAAIRGEEYILPDFSEVVKYYSPHWTRYIEKVMYQKGRLILRGIYEGGETYL